MPKKLEVVAFNSLSKVNHISMMRESASEGLPRVRSNKQLEGRPMSSQRPKPGALLNWKSDLHRHSASSMKRNLIRNN